MLHQVFQQPPDNIAFAPAIGSPVSCGFPIRFTAAVEHCPLPARCSGCQRRSTLCFKLMAAQGHGYSGTSGLLLGLSSINQFRSDLALSCCCDATLTHYILSPLSTLLRCQARVGRPCTLIPSRHYPTRSSTYPRHAFYRVSAPFRYSSLTSALSTSTSTLTSKQPPSPLPNNLAFAYPCSRWSVFSSAVHLGRTHFCR